MTDSPDFDDQTNADDVGGPDDTLRPAEAIDSDDVRNQGGDEVVDPPEHWHEADKDTAEHEALDDKLAAEEPDVQHGRGDHAGAHEFTPADVDRDTVGHRGQVDDSPEDGDSLFPVVE